MRERIRSLFLSLLVPFIGIGVVAAGVEESKLLPSDGEQLARFGAAVSMDADTAAIGAPRDANAGGSAGAVYIFERMGGNWSEEQKLLADDGASLDLFGDAVALDSDTLLVGAPDDDDNGQQSGSAYVFTRAGGVWTQQAKLIPNDGSEKSRFGTSVDLDGDVAIIGSPGDGSGDFVGQAYIFERFGTSWNQGTKLFPADGLLGDGFGESVAIDGDFAAVGSRGHDQEGLQSGAVYIYRKTSSWLFETKLTASDAEAFKAFGSSVAMDGELLAVGSVRDFDNGTWSGSGYIFRRVLLAWNEEAKLLPSDGESFALFGERVTVHGNNVIFGSPGLGSSGFSGMGSAYVFGPIEGEWTERFKLLPAGLGDDANFGGSVTVFGDSAIVGAPGDEDFGLESGSAFAYELPPIPPDNVPAMGGVGAALLILSLVGGSAWFIRRR